MPDFGFRILVRFLSRVRVCFRVSLCLFVAVFVSLLVGLFVCSFVRLFVCWFARLFVCLCVCVVFVCLCVFWCVSFCVYIFSCLLAGWLVACFVCVSGAMHRCHTIGTTRGDKAEEANKSKLSCLSVVC